MKREEVFVLVVDLDRDNKHIEVHGTRDGAFNGLREYCVDNWREGTPIPDDTTTLVGDYFYYCAPLEYYSITPITTR